MKAKLIFVLLMVSCGMSVSAASAADFKAAVQSAVKDFQAALAAKDSGKIGKSFAQTQRRVTLRRESAEGEKQKPEKEVSPDLTAN